MSEADLSTSTQPTGAAGDPGSTGSLKQLAIRGSFFELLGYGLSMVLRLGSNLLLTRMLFPEAFGLTALVTMILFGLEMLSDVGLQVSVIQNERGDEQEFLNTVWTIQVARGFLLWIVALVLTYPVAIFYEEPELIYLIPVGALSVVLTGFSSTSLYTMRRHLRLGAVNFIEIGARLASVIAMITWAMISPTVWALAAGGVVNGLVKLIASHAIPIGYRNRFHWNREAAHEIIHFGKWIFAATGVFFLGSRADHAMLGHYLGMSVLGVYSIAVLISDQGGAVVGKITHGVLFPIYSRYARRGNEALREAYYKARLVMDVLALPAIGGLMALGSWLVELGWDERYAAAGWMLELLCIRVAMICVLDTTQTLLLSLGHTRWIFYRNLTRTIWIIGGMPIAFSHWGIEGLVWVIALSEVPVLFVLWPAFWKAGFLRIEREILAAVLFLLGLGVGHLLKGPLMTLTAEWM